MIIKYPNWYEHFHGLGYDLAEEAHMFDGIYTGTETRDPVITDQLLQQYESYEIYRYLSNVRPGANLGVWATRTIRARSTATPSSCGTGCSPRRRSRCCSTGARWPRPSRRPPASGRGPGSRPASNGRSAAAAGRALRTRRCTSPTASLGRARQARSGVASYRPPHATGEDFLHNYIGNLGVPIELYPEYPATAHTILLTQSAAADPQIIAKIHASLTGGANVIVTSGFLEAMQGRGFGQLAEWRRDRARDRDRPLFRRLRRRSRQASSRKPAKTKPVLFPEVRFYTNDSWGIIRGVAAAKGFPMVLMNHYSKGTLYLWTMPENFGDLYSLPQPMVTRIKDYLFADRRYGSTRRTMSRCSPMTMGPSSSKITATMRRGSALPARGRQRPRG